MPMSLRPLVVVLCVLAIVAGCERDRLSARMPRLLTPPGPVDMVERRLEELRENDLVGFARRAVPPALYAELDTAWALGSSRWPLTELPLDERLPGLLAALSEPQAERTLSASYRREFAGAHAELRSAAGTLGTLSGRYLRSEGDYSANERAHYVQLVDALTHWGQRAPLGEPVRARQAIARLTGAARRTGFDGEAALSDAGMRTSLKRLGPFFGELKQVLTGYGLDFDHAFATARIELVRQQGDHAQVRVRYALAGRPVEARLDMERLDGHWYLSDVLRHARAQRRPELLAKAPGQALPGE